MDVLKSIMPITIGMLIFTILFALFVKAITSYMGIYV